MARVGYGRRQAGAMSKLSKADPKLWATAFSIVAGASVAFVSSPNWQLAALVTIIIAVITYQFMQLRECMAKHEECNAALHARDQSITVLYLLAERSLGRRRMPPLERFLGKEYSLQLIDEVRQLVNDHDDEDLPRAPAPKD